MKADLWISGDACRILVTEGGVVIDTNESWNNRASAELAVYDLYPEAIVKFHRDSDKIKALEEEWQRCMGN